MTFDEVCNIVEDKKNRNKIIEYIEYITACCWKSSILLVLLFGTAK